MIWGKWGYENGGRGEEDERGHERREEKRGK